MKIEMAHIERIRWLRLGKGRSQRATAKELKLSRNTVAKYEKLTEPPKRQRTRPDECPVLGPFKEEIERLLRQNETLPPKQRWIGHTIFERLVELGYQGSESGLRRYIGKLRKEQKKAEAFVPLAFRPGEAAQFDLAEVEVVIGGQRVQGQMVCVRLLWSHMPFVALYPNQRQESVLDGLRCGFEHLGGVPEELIGDNLRQAVKKILDGKRRQEQELFLRFRTHYLFESRFCNPGAGWEKGSVENLAGFAQRNLVGPQLEAASWEEANALLWQRCLAYARRTFARDRETVEERWRQEQRVLRPLPPVAFPCCRTVPVTANRVSLVRFETNWYSVPCGFAGQSLILRAYWDRIEVWNGMEKVAGHRRCYGQNEEVLELDHYLDVLLRKPGALDHARPFQAAALPEVYHVFRKALGQRHPHGDREFVRILLLHREFADEQVAAALAEALHQQTVHFEAVRQILLRRTPAPPGPLETASRLPEVKVQQPKPGAYNRLLKGGWVY